MWYSSFGGHLGSTQGQPTTGAETVCTLEELVWLVSKHQHLRQSVLVPDLMLQGRTTLSPMSGVDSFVFPVVPLQGTTTVISIKTRLTWPSWTSHLLSHPPGQRNVHQGKSQAQKCRFNYCPAPISLSYLPKAQAASCVLKHVQQSQKTKPAKCTPSHAFAIWAPHDSKARWLFSGDLRQKGAILLRCKMPGPCLFEDQISLEAKAWHFRSEKQNLFLMPWKPNKEQ